MARIIDVQRLVQVELSDKEGTALFKLLEEITHSPNMYGHLVPYNNTLHDLKTKLRPYFDDIPF